MTTTVTDRIEKEILLQAPSSRVWRALTDSKEFGAWFQVVFNGPFRPGQRISGRITYPGKEHLKFELEVEAMEPERRFSFRWHPHAIDPNRDYSKEPMTLVEFTLEEVEGGTMLRLVESGFDQIPIDRRATALKSNDGGWTAQMKAIEKYLRQNP
jgi:uncharacterized protein YndB with AHSA1/START domain